MTERAAFLSEEGGAASAVTEGAAHEQVCMQVSLIRQDALLTPSVFACGESSSLNEGAKSPLCRYAASLPEGETSFGLCLRRTHIAPRDIRMTERQHNSGRRKQPSVQSHTAQQKQ